jgi:glycosyltransferase involved in cell wall biosynthesis
MSYYRPTSLAQKIYKLIRLFFCYIRVKLTPRAQARKAKHTSVLMVISQLDRTGGLERQLLELCSALIRERFLITILTDQTGNLPGIEFQSGFLIRRLKRSSNPFFLLVQSIGFVFHHRRSFQLIHIHGVTGFTLLFILVARILRRPVLLKGATNGDFEDLFHQHDFKHRLYQKLILSTNQIVAISEEIKHELLSCGVSQDRIIRIPNGVHSEKFFPASTAQKSSHRNRFSIDPRQVVFLYLGRLESRKAIDVLLSAWQLKSPGLLWIVGSGPEQQKWKQLSHDLNLNNIRFHEESLSPLDFYRCADVFVLPSFKEGMPGALLEAMSCGLPSVATKIGGVVDVVHHEEQGLLVSPGAPHELADALEFMASHPEKRIQWGKSARETVLERFEISRIVARYNSLYAKILSSRES